MSVSTGRSEPYEAGRRRVRERFFCWLFGHKESIGYLGSGTCERCRRYIGPGPVDSKKGAR